MIPLIEAAQAHNLAHPEPEPPFLTPLLSPQDAPLLRALDRHRFLHAAAFSTPGHKGGQSAESDVVALLGSEIFASDIWLNMEDHDQALGEAETLAAMAWGADRSWFLVNGSSSGNHSFMLGHVRPGDKVIIGRDAHRSMQTALVMSGAVPISVAPTILPDLHMNAGIDPDAVARALEEHPDARLVVITSPNYHGISSDLRTICAIAHGHGVPVFVDAAWGAHFGFHPAFGESAMAAGADAAIVSVHKTLSALSQGALLLANDDRLDLQRLGGAVRATQTTSRCLPILVSIDAARRQMASHGWELLCRTLALAGKAKELLGTIPEIEVIDSARLGASVHAIDPTRLVIDTHRLGVSGGVIERILREEFGVAPEMSDAAGIVCLVTIGDTTASIESLVGAIQQVAARYPLVSGHGQTPVSRSVGNAILPSEQVMSPRDAYYAQTERVMFADAVGRTCAELIVPYPPGIPVLAPGERITADKVSYLTTSSAGSLHCPGASDPTLTTVAVTIQ